MMLSRAWEVEVTSSLPGWRFFWLAWLCLRLELASLKMAGYCCCYLYYPIPNISSSPSTYSLSPPNAYAHYIAPELNASESNRSSTIL